MSNKGTYIQKAEKYYEAAKHKEAVYWYSRAITEDMKDAELFAQRGVAHYHLGDLPSALADLNTALELEPQNPYRHSSRAYMRDAMGDTAGAIADYEKAIRLDPDDAVAHNNLGMLEEKMGRNQKAQTLFAFADKLMADSGQTEPIGERPKNIQAEINSTRREENLGSVVKSVLTSRKGFANFLTFVRKGFK